MGPGRLLILDDDATVAQILRMAAQASGFEARHCETPADFFETLPAWAPTHVAVDLTLPGTSGLAVLRQLAASGCRARVLVCSGAGAADLQQALDEAAALGLDTAGPLPKPFTLATLRALLAR
jgi:ActR/RegA family two-component response regulator